MNLGDKGAGSASGNRFNYHRYSGARDIGWIRSRVPLAAASRSAVVKSDPYAAARVRVLALAASCHTGRAPIRRNVKGLCEVVHQVLNVLDADR